MKNGFVIVGAVWVMVVGGAVSSTLASGLDINATINIPLSGEEVASESGRKNGPPPHAPAHGYRHKNADGVTLEFDSGLGVYVALGFNDIFFTDDHYLRTHDGQWQVAFTANGPWREAAKGDVPEKLKTKKSNNKSNKGNGNGNAKKAKK